jgi:hypothetical protein
MKVTCSSRHMAAVPVPWRRARLFQMGSKSTICGLTSCNLNLNLNLNLVLIPILDALDAKQTKDWKLDLRGYLVYC